MQVPFRQGIVKSVPNFIQLTGSTVSLVVPQPTYILVTVADGSSDYLIAEKESVSNAWIGPFSSGTDYWLFWDIHPTTGVKSYGHTLYEPIESSLAPSTPYNDQHWYDSASHKMKVWNAVAGRWVEKIRVFAARLTNSSQLVSMSINSPAFEGTQVGSYVSTPVLSGYLVFDNEGKALRKGSGKFFTTEDVGVAGITNSSRVKLSSIVREAEAAANMAGFTVVAFTDFDTVEPADPIMVSQGKLFGLIEEDVVIGDYVNVVFEGMVSSSLWDWTSIGINAPLYIGAGGVLSTTPTAPALNPIAVVSGIHSIQFGVPKVVNTIVGGTVVEAMSPTVQGTAKLSVAAANPVDPIVVGNNDPRLSDARYPLAHDHIIGDVTGLQGALDGLAPVLMTEVVNGVGRLSLAAVSPADPVVVGDNDPRLTDARLPLTHNHAISDVSGLQLALDGNLSLTGGTLTGPLTLSGDPTLALHAATKQYVDAAGGGGGGVVEPWGQVVFGTGTGATSSPDLFYDTDNGQFHFNSSSTPFLYPGNVELYAAPTNRNFWSARGGSVYVSAGNCEVGTGYGGDAEFAAGDAVTGTSGGSGGTVNISSGGGQYGGTVYITGGTGTGYGNGGPIEIASGAGTGGDAGGGYVAIIAGGGNYSGDMVLKCNPVTGMYGNRGGNTDLMAGSTTQTGRAGRVTLAGGDTTTSVSYKQGGRFYVTEGGETLTGTPVSTAAATISTVKEHIQTSLETNPFSVGFPDVSLVSCARRFVINTYASGAVAHSVPVRIPSSAMWTFRAQVAVSDLAASNNFAGYEVTGVLAEFGGTVTVYSPVVTTLHATGTAASWTVVATADNVNKTLVFTITTPTGTVRAMTVDITQAR